MNAYYNEHDPFAAAWLRELIRGGHITPGVVDERDIQLVQPSDLVGFTRCHFFAGIGGWDHALNLAGWGDRPVWTGSCPCQPFSSAGKGEGFNDPRHLWPAWFRLIRECRPPVVFGEQVASAAGLAWFDTVSTDLEAEAYAVGAADLPAAGVGAPHIRQRLFFVADAERRTAERYGQHVAGAPRGVEGRTQERERLRADARDGGDAGPLADTEHSERRPLSGGPRFDGCDGPNGGWEEAHGEPGARSQVLELADSERGRCEPGRGPAEVWTVPEPDTGGVLGDPDDERRQAGAGAGAGAGAITQPHGSGGSSGRMADTPGERAGQQGATEPSGNGSDDGVPRPHGSVGDADREREGALGGVRRGADPDGARGAGGMGDSSSDGREQRGLPEHAGLEGAPGPEPDGSGARGHGDWTDLVWLPCRDGKARPTQSSVLGMADGLPDDLGLVRVERRAQGEIEGEDVVVLAPLVARGKHRVGRLRGYGNAIVPQAAAEVISAFMDLER